MSTGTDDDNIEIINGPGGARGRRTTPTTSPR